MRAVSSWLSAPARTPIPSIHGLRGRTFARTMTQPTDRELVERARQGDAKAFGDLVRRYQPRIYRLAVHMLRERSDAEDVAQETFLRAFRALGSFDGRSEPYTWFYRIAVNLSLNRLRARRPGHTSHDADDPRLDGLLTDRHPESGDPHDSAHRKRLYQALCDGIDELSDTLRTTLILVSIDGRSHDDVATILGAPAGTIAWRVHEARRKLRERLRARGFDLDLDGDGT